MSGISAQLVSVGPEPQLHTELAQGNRGRGHRASSAGGHTGAGDCGTAGCGLGLRPGSPNTFQ